MCVWVHVCVKYHINKSKEKNPVIIKKKYNAPLEGMADTILAVSPATAFGVRPVPVCAPVTGAVTPSVCNMSPHDTERVRHVWSHVSMLSVRPGASL